MTSLSQDLIGRIQDRTATIGIIGLGYVGIPLALSVVRNGLRVIGFDIKEPLVRNLNAGQSPIKHIPDSDIAMLVDNGFEAVTDPSRATECDALIICVPTPLDKHREPDLTFVKSTMDTFAPYFRKGQLLSLESTTWPGTTHEVLAPFAETRGLTIGEDFFLVYSPEREDPGNANFETFTIPKVLGGETPTCTAVGSALYASFIQTVVPVSSTQAAEMVKLLENIHRSVNIGLANEMKIVADAMGLDIFEVIDAAKTKPFGFTAYYPGPGVGGHCIPIDPFYLSWKAREYGVQTRFIELAGEVNAAMPQYVVDKTIRALNARGKSLNGARILAVGIAYKKNVDDMRESPSVFVMEMLRDWGAEMAYHDPHVPVFPDMREHDFDLSSEPLSAANVASFDAVILLTDHADVDYDLLLENAQVLIDTRGRYRGETAVIKA